ncbi:MAG: FtsQ-type POTRA domain-containing protein [Actinomycetota bacterium]|jgi:cell division protein FtsQ|nr:FtsQ-type POTRA domain-containing protein [Actinomycetota bacterium]
MNGRKAENKKIAARRRKVALRRFWYFFKFFLMFLFLGAAVYGLNYFYNSEYFKIKEIEISGYQHYSQQELSACLGSFKGKNFFEVDQKMVEEVIFKDCSWVKEINFSKVFPDKVSVAVIERKPFLIAHYRGGYFLLDNQGVVLESISPQELEQYNQIVLVVNALDFKPEIGDKVAKKNVLSCGEVYSSMDNELRTIFKHAQVESGLGDIIFITNQGGRVVFGSSDHIPQKLSILKELLKDDVNYNIIDLTNFENPVIN